MAQRAYIAFISYRHAPLDIRVAKALQRSIERYSVPRGIHTDLPGRKLGYVFRDQDELGLSSDLTSDITDALEHARYLIVVCTPDTPGSAWVRREISYFISTHGRDRVLAVLAAGTPDTSFPQELLINEAGESVEPLAADITGDNELQVLRALRRENPRVMSALLGCSYDDLVQRERAYRRQRKFTIVSLFSVVALAFLVVLLAKNREITRQNEELAAQGAAITEKNNKLLHDQVDLMRQQNALEAQNTHLQTRVAALQCDHARTALRVRDIPLAIRLSIEALEAENDDAADVLYEALGLNDHEEPCLTRLFTQEQEVLDMRVSPDGSALLTLDMDSEIRAYSLQDGACLWVVDASGASSLMCMDKVALARCESTLRAFDMETGKELWLLKGASPVALAASGDSLAAIRDGRLLFIDARGEVFTDVELPESASGLTGAFDPAEITFAGACSTADGTHLFSVSLPDGAFSALSLENEICLAVAPLDGGTSLLTLACAREDARLLIIRTISAPSGDVLSESVLTMDDAWIDVSQRAALSLVLTGARAWGLCGPYLFSIDLDDALTHAYICSADLLCLDGVGDSFTALTADGQILKGADDGQRVTLTYAARAKRIPPLTQAISVNGGFGMEGGTVIGLPADARETPQQYAIRPTSGNDAIRTEFNRQDMIHLGEELLYGLRETVPETAQEDFHTENVSLQENSDFLLKQDEPAETAEP